MCTAITFKMKNAYFGRNLDIERSYNECVTITPRNFALKFRMKDMIKKHYAIIGMATVIDNYPLYFDATNEFGLSMAGLNFPDNAVYFPPETNKDNITSFEFIPWILSQCKNLDEARVLLARINLCNINFSENLPLSPLHWIIADKCCAITVESVKEGLGIYDNPVGVLTNNPPFYYHMTHLCNYINITPNEPENRFGSVSLMPYSRGMGGIGLPGDLSSSSRFVRAAFIKLNSICESDENSSISQFFHILSSVSMLRGAARIAKDECEITEYTSCVNMDKGIYYYNTYENNCICAVDMYKCNLNDKTLYTYPLTRTQEILWQN